MLIIFKDVEFSLFTAFWKLTKRFNLRSISEYQWRSINLAAQYIPSLIPLKLLVDWSKINIGEVHHTNSAWRGFKCCRKFQILRDQTHVLVFCRCHREVLLVPQSCLVLKVNLSCKQGTSVVVEISEYSAC